MENEKQSHASKAMKQAFNLFALIACPVLIILAVISAAADQTGFVILSLFLCTVLFLVSKGI